MNDMTNEVVDLVNCYDLEEKLLDYFYSDELNKYFNELEDGSSYQIARLILDNSDPEVLENIFKVEADFTEATDYLNKFYFTLNKYNRRLDNSCDDLWRIFEENSTHHPKEMMLSIILPVMVKMKLVDEDSVKDYFSRDWY